MLENTVSKTEPCLTLAGIYQADDIEKMDQVQRVAEIYYSCPYPVRVLVCIQDIRGNITWLTHVMHPHVTWLRVRVMDARA